MTGILVIGEVVGGNPQSISWELLSAGRSLSDPLGEEVAIAFLSEDQGDFAGEAIAQGADRVYNVQDPLLDGAQIDAHVAALEQVCRQTEPSVVLVGRTTLGRDLGPRLAYRLGVAMAQDCVELSVDADTKRVIATRPVYGGNAMARFAFMDADPQVAVVRAKVYEPLQPDSSRNGEVVPLQVRIDPAVVKSRLVETVKREVEGVRLEDAAVVVGGGRGLGGSDPFAALEELAQLLGGAVGASRAVCDAGWIDHSYQIGLTGKTVTPNLYITVGISGASQHMAGCSGAKHIVAINRDPEANIFKAASFGAVGDWKNIVPSFIETVRELVSS